jgi:hypothetical protein
MESAEVRPAETVSPWLTVEQLAARWQMTIGGLRKARVRKKTPPATRMGKELRFHIADVEEHELHLREAARGL